MRAKSQVSVKKPADVPGDGVRDGRGLAPQDRGPNGPVTRRRRIAHGMATARGLGVKSRGSYDRAPLHGTGSLERAETRVKQRGDAIGVLPEALLLTAVGTMSCLSVQSTI